MMEIIRSIEELERLHGPLFLAIGVFDGMHRGHQAVISTSTSHARSGNGTPLVVTFDPHPVKVLRPNDAPHLLTATQHKIALIRDLGVDHLLVINFDKKFAATPPEKFVEHLVAHSKPLREICVGHEWSFGKDRRGNLDLLKELGAHSEQFPPNGVYLAEAWIQGVLYHGVVNLGYRPTVSGGRSERVLEIYLLDFNRDIYGENVEVRFVRYLRPERKFDNLEALVRQIDADVQQARELFAT